MTHVSQPGIRNLLIACALLCASYSSVSAQMVGVLGGSIPAMTNHRTMPAIFTMNIARPGYGGIPVEGTALQYPSNDFNDEFQRAINVQDGGLNFYSAHFEQGGASTIKVGVNGDGLMLLVQW
jgi:hypothetical protein